MWFSQFCELVLLPHAGAQPLVVSLDRATLTVGIMVMLSGRYKMAKSIAARHSPDPATISDLGVYEVDSQEYE